MIKKKCLLFGIMIFLSMAMEVSAEPFLAQWEWQQPKIFGKIKTIIKEEAVYNIKQIFNNRGQKIEEQLLNKGNIIYKTIFHYNEAGQLFILERYSPDGKLLVRDQAVYEDGVIKFMESSQEPKKGKFFYDQNAHLDEIVTFNEDGKRTAKYVYRFNELGDLVETRVLNALLELREKKVFFNNDKGLPVGELTYHPDGRLRRKNIYRYEYDNQGNWIIREVESEVMIGDEKSKTDPVVEKRKLTYFNI